MYVCVSPADDGKLSLDEFQAFFSDGTLNEEELEKLFHTIDSDNTRSGLPRHYSPRSMQHSFVTAGNKSAWGPLWHFCMCVLVPA